jgi:hypothetical protein
MLQKVEGPGQFQALVVVADEVPAVDGAFAAKVRQEGVDAHLPTRPSEDGIGLGRHNGGNLRAHLFFAAFNGSQQLGRTESFERSFAFFEAPRARQGVTVGVGAKVADD